MNIALCTIQRDRSRWIREWVAFHHLNGVRKFYIYLHKCSDDSVGVVTDLSRHFDITAFTLADDVFRPQLAAYRHCYSEFGGRHDWIGFIDGDEFLFPTEGGTIGEQLASLNDEPIDALGVYWACFGSSGHMSEPEGLVTENYRLRASLDFDPNHHFKSLVRGGLGEGFSVLQNSHYFRTPRGTVDTRMRPLSHGWIDHEPCYERLRINHYVTQSREYFLRFKQHSGAADVSAEMVRSEQWWQDHDRNEEWDDSLVGFLPELHAIMATLNR